MMTYASDDGMVAAVSAYTADYEAMAHEAALTYFQTHDASEMEPSEFSKTYLTIYHEILSGLQGGTNIWEN